MKQINWMTVGKIVVFVAGVGVNVAQGIIAGKELSGKVAKEVAEQLANK